MVLDRYYIGTRYPDGLPDITPNQAYGAEDSEQALVMATTIIKLVESYI